MKKKRLDPNALKVETFEALDPEGLYVKGTVEGYAATDVPCCTASCGGTCGAYPDTTWIKGGADANDARFRTFLKCCV